MQVTTDLMEEVTLSPGDVVSLTNVAEGLSLALVVEPIGRQDGAVMLARREQPYHRLHRSAQREGKLSWKHVRFLVRS